MSKLLFVFLLFALIFTLAEAKRPRIVGGTLDTPGQFPFMVRLLIGPRNDKGFCGGSIIDRYHVATAAHCFGDDSAFPLTISVRYGAVNKDNFKRVRAISYIIHPEYNDETSLNDIALIRLVKPLNFSSVVQPLVFATSPPEDGTTIYGAGWGDTSSGGDLSDNLLWTDFLYLDFQRCIDQFGATDLQEESQVCAGGVDNHDTCQGDSGGPIFTASNINDPTTMRHLGIVSYGEGCGGLPAIYTRVPGYGDDWLSNTIADRTACLSACTTHKAACEDAGRLPRVLGQKVTCDLLLEWCNEGCPS